MTIQTTGAVIRRRKHSLSPAGRMPAVAHATAHTKSDLAPLMSQLQLRSLVAYMID